MASFHDEILSNKRKTYFLLFLFSAIVVGMGYVFGWYIGSPYLGMIIAFVIGVIYSLIVFNRGDSIILASSHAKPVTRESDPQLINIVEGLAIAAQIPMPKVYMIQEEALNAFATGKNPEHSYVVVTSGLRKKMSKLELEGVIAHELSHIKNYDIRVMMLVTVLLGIIVLLSDIIFRTFIWAPRRDNRGGGGAIFLVIGILLAILAPIVAQLIHLTVSRKREFLADATGAKLTRYPEGLASALEKIRDHHDVIVDTANKATAHLYIENPLKDNKGWLSSLFSTHPNINDRIKRLRAM